MHPIINVATKAARAAGDIMTRAQDRLDTIRVAEKSPNNFVTDIDKRCEQAIITVLQEAYPDYSIFAEESGEIGNQASDYLWIIDPLDGTNNFIHGLPHFAISIALRVRGRIEQGVIFDPIRNELFSATRGQGAQLNNRRIRIANETKLERSIIGLGFARRSRPDLLEQGRRFVNNIQSKCGGLRRTGSAALDLAYVAAGRLNGFWELGLAPWDVAAGSILIKEAGGLVCDTNGGEDYIATGNVVAGNAKILKALLQLT